MIRRKKNLQTETPVLNKDTGVFENRKVKTSKEERREKTWYYRQDGNKKVKAFCDYIYKDATIFMERKYKLYQDLVKVSGN